MPRKHTRDRSFIGPNHIYNRASRGRSVFRCDEDRDVFLDLIETRLRRAKFRNRTTRDAAAKIETEISSCCLMNTHFHLIVWQFECEALRRLMQSVLAIYVRYYNHRYHQQGPLFSGPFRANPLTDDKQFRWTTAYVHANHPSGPDYEYSTHRAFLDGDLRPGWLTTRRALERFGGVDNYVEYMERRAIRAEINDDFF
jgi:REP element-mobilizing transposase RayT